MALIHNQVDYWDEELINFKEKVFDPIILHKFYIEAMQEENLVSLYQIITQIFKLSKYSDFNSINVLYYSIRHFLNYLMKLIWQNFI